MDETAPKRIPLNAPKGGGVLEVGSTRESFVVTWTPNSSERFKGYTEIRTYDRNLGTAISEALGLERGHRIVAEIRRYVAEAKIFSSEVLT